MVMVTAARRPGTAAAADIAGAAGPEAQSWQRSWKRFPAVVGVAATTEWQDGATFLGRLALATSPACVHSCANRRPAARLMETGSTELAGHSGLVGWMVLCSGTLVLSIGTTGLLDME